jgi:hypothetical protein
MKFLATGATVVLLISGAAMAQAPGDKPAANQAPGVTLVTGNESRHARDADARHCLALKTDVELYRCAEKYLYRGSRPKAPPPEKPRS